MLRQNHIWLPLKSYSVSEGGIKPDKNKEPVSWLCREKELKVCWLIQTSPARPWETQVLCAEPPSASPVIKLCILKENWNVFHLLRQRLQYLSTHRELFLKAKHRLSSHRHCHRCCANPSALRGWLDPADKTPKVTPSTLRIFLQISSFLRCSKILLRHLGGDRAVNTKQQLFSHYQSRRRKTSSHIQ